MRRGERPTPSYTSWAQMKSRCYNPRHKDYYRYGGRGISVSERWHSFKGFYEDMGDRPPKTTLGRIDNNGNYEPSNCRWENAIQQASNKCNNRFINLDGATKTISCLSRDTGIPIPTIISRLNTGKDALVKLRNKHLKITVNGITKSLSEWSTYTGIPKGTIMARRLKYKWSDEKSVTAPVNKTCNWRINDKSMGKLSDRVEHLDIGRRIE